MPGPQHTSIIPSAAVAGQRMSGKPGAVGAASGQPGILTGPEETAPGDWGRPGGMGSQSHRRTLVVSKCVFHDRNGSTT